MMDEVTATENRPLFSWEQYLVPAVGRSPLTGDLLRRHGIAWDDPSGYRLVVSPSCDLVLGRNESTVLVAKCGGAAALLKKVGLAGISDKEKVKSRVLSPGFASGCLPLPAFPKQIPLLFALLKELEVVPYEQIGPDPAVGATYKRVASIDSPFREQVAWAFLSTGARPGMPDRDLDAWASALVEAAKPPADPAAKP
jgi:CTP synthase